MPRIVWQPLSSASAPSGLVEQPESPHSSKWPISKSIATFGPSVAHGTTCPGDAVAYMAWKSKAVVVQSVWLALCTYPLAPLATMNPVVDVVRSLTSVRRPFAVSVIVTRIVSPLFISSFVPPGDPFVVTNAAVVGSLQLFFWNSVAFCSVLMCRLTHHCVVEQLMPGG